MDLIGATGVVQAAEPPSTAGERACPGARPGRGLSVDPELVAITAPGMVWAGEDGVEVVVHRQVASAEGVGVPGGKPDDQPGGQCGVGAVAGPQLPAYPGVDAGFRRAGRGAAASARSVSPIGVMPGCTLNTRTPLWLASAARFSVNLMTAALETE